MAKILQFPTRRGVTVAEKDLPCDIFAQRYQLTNAHGTVVGFMWLVATDDDRLEDAEAAARAVLDALDPRPVAARG